MQVLRRKNSRRLGIIMQENKKLVLIFALLIISTIVVAGVSILQKSRIKKAEHTRQMYKLGEIYVDPEKKVIWFN